MDEATSHVAQYGAIMQAAQEKGIGFTVYQQPEAWEGDEVAKRSFMFRLAEAHTTEDDWYCVIDADEFLEEHPADLRDQLASTDKLAGIVRFMNPGKADQHVRILFRALRGMHCHVNHYTFVSGDGRILWGNEFDGTKVEPYLDLRDSFKVKHLSDFRHDARHEAQWEYYKERDAEGREMGQCKWEGCENNAVRLMPFDLQPVELDYTLPDGTVIPKHKFMSGSWIELCAEHTKRQIGINNNAFRQNGFDPDDPNLRQYAAPNDVAAQVREALE